MSQRGQRIVLGLLLAALLLILFRIAWPFVSAFILASMLATVMHPVNYRLSRRLRRPGLASLLTTVATVIVAGTTIAFVCVTIVKSSANAYNALNQRSIQRGGGFSIVNRTDQIVDALAKRLPVPKETIKGEILNAIKVGAGYLLKQTQQVLENMASILVTTVFAMVFLYYLLRYGEQWLSQATALIPLSPHITANLLRTAHQSIVANVNGVLVVALAQGLFLSLGFWFLGIASPLQWGMFGALASLVPFVGATLIWVPVVIGFIFAGSFSKALVLALWGGLVVGSLDNIIRPLVVGAGERQNPLLIGFAMLGGTYAFGPLGILLGPLAVALTGTLIEEIQGIRGDDTNSLNGIKDEAHVLPNEPSSTASIGKQDEIVKPLLIPSSRGQ